MTLCDYCEDRQAVRDGTCEFCVSHEQRGYDRAVREICEWIARTQATGPSWALVEVIQSKFGKGGRDE